MSLRRPKPPIKGGSAPEEEDNEKYPNWTNTFYKFNPLNPNDHYIGRTAPLPSKSCILHVYSTNIGTEYFKHGINSPFVSLQNAVCFIILTYLVPVFFTFYTQDALKKIRRQKVKYNNIFVLRSIHSRTRYIKIHANAHIAASHSFSLETCSVLKYVTFIEGIPKKLNPTLTKNKI